jgi:hypothetical protein
MSSAARDPLPADELSALVTAQLMVHEAVPDPAPGPERDELAAGGAARIDQAVAMMDAAINGYSERLASVVEARMRSPKTRKGTRWWSPTKALAAASMHGEEPTAGGVREPFSRASLDGVRSEENRGLPDSPAHIRGVEVKALDADYVLPERTIDELADAVRPVGLRIVSDASAAVAKSLGRPNVGLAALDWKAIDDAVDSVVARMMDVNERHARDIRREILNADATAGSLDEATRRVTEAVRRGGRWLLLSGRTLATALAGDAALAAAKALGVTHAQWLSRRDDRVRKGHVIADGQERAIGSKFIVDGFRLRFPADPTDLPASWHTVAGCRCSLLFSRPAPQRQRAVALAEQGTSGAARRLLQDAALPRGSVVLGAPELGGPSSIPELSVPVDVVGYRVLDREAPVAPGQRLGWPGALALALAPPAVAGAAVLAVAVPAGTAVGVAGGTMVLPAGATLAVASVTSGQVVATPVTTVSA